MLDKDREIYEFGPFRLDISERHLWRDGEPQTLTPKVFDLLVLLVRNHGRLLEKDELVEELWGESFVEEANLNVNISALRRALGETPTENKFIETVPRRGYRFVAEVRKIETEKPAVAVAKKESPKTVRKFSAGTVLIVSAAVLAVFVAAGIYFRRPATDAENHPGEVRTLAVLPFQPLTKSGRDEILEMGMADALITRLGNLRQISVRPTSAVLKYAETERDFTGIGRELQVEAILDGRIQKVENRIRVTVQLIRVSDGASLWADSFDDHFTNIFAVQDSISEKIAGKLSIRLTRAEEESIAKRPTENSEAYRLYLEGIFHHNKASPEELKKAREFYLKAHEKDSEYVLPVAALAEVHQGLANFNIEREENNRRAVEFAERALRLDPDSAEAHMAVGKVKVYIEWNFAEGEKAYRRAVELKPNDSGIRHSYSFYFSNTRRHDEAVREMREALRLDPVSVYINNDFVRILMNARRFDEALEQAKKAVELDARYVFAHRNLALAYSAKGMHREAVAELQKEAELGGLKKISSVAGYVYARAGNRAEAEKILLDYRSSLDQTGVNHLNVAQIYAGLGDTDRALEWLEKSFQKRESILLSLNTYPEWDGLRDDPRFRQLLERIGFPE